MSLTTALERVAELTASFSPSQVAPATAAAAAPAAASTFTQTLQAATAALISAAQLIRGLIKRGVNHGNIPTKS